VSLFRPRKKTLLSIAVVFLAIALSGGFYLWRVPLDMSQYKGRIIAECEDITGATVTTGAATLRILPSPYIEVDDVRMSSPKGEILRADQMRLHVSVMPFFLKKVVIEKMTVEGWTLHVRRETDGYITLRDIYARIIKRKHIVSVKSMRLEDGQLFIDDMLGNRGLHLKADLSKGQIETEGGTMRFQADLAIDGGTNIYTQGAIEKVGGKLRIRGRGVIEALKLSTLSPYVKRPVMKGSVSGDIAFIYGDALSINGPVNYKDVTITAPSLAPAPLHSPSGKATIALKLKDKTLDFKAGNASISMDDFAINGSLALKGDTSKSDNLGLSLNITTTAIPIKKVKSLVLDKIFNNGRLAWINELTPLGGGISVKGLTLNTTIKELRGSGAFSRPGAMRMEAVLEGLDFRHRLLGIEEIKGLNGEVLLGDDSIDFQGLSASIGPGFIQKLSYKMDNLLSHRKPASYELSLLGHMDAGRAIALTIRVFRNSGESVKKQLRRISATGDTRIKFGLRGKIDVADSTWFSINLGLKGSTFRYEGFPLSFTSMDGNIDIDNHRFTFTDLNLSDSADSRFTVGGYVKDYTDINPDFHLKTRGVVYGGTLSAFTSGTAFEGLVLNDSLSFSSTLSGAKKSLKVSADIDLGATGFEYKKLIKKAAGIPLYIGGELLLTKDAIKITKADVKTKASSLEVKGRFAREPKKGRKGTSPYSLFINAKKLRLYDLADITPLITKREDTAGLLNIILKTSRGRGEKKPKYSGLISINNGSFATPITKEPFKALDLFLDFDGDKAKLRCPDIKIGSSDLHGSVDISSISGRVIKFSLFSTRLNTSDIWGHDAGSMADWRKKISEAGLGATHGKARSAVPITGSGKISVKKGIIHGEEVKDLKTVIILSPKSIGVEPIVFITKGGTVSGKGLLYRNDKNPRLFEGSASITGIHLKKLLKLLGAKKDILTGTLNGNVEINCERGRTPFARCLNGKFFLKAERGRMWKFRVLSKIFTIVNIISIDELFKKGLPYKTLTGNFVIKNGVVSTDDLLFSSDAMRMSAVMDMDSAKGTIDATLGVHPFVTIDKVVTTIPLLGWIIGGDEKSSVSLYYSIKGPLTKPAVKPARIKNIKKGILGKMERLFTSPIKIIQESSKMIKHKDKKGKNHE